MNTDEIKLEKKNEIGIITLNKPPLNLLDAKMLHRLDGYLEEMKNDGEIRVVIITGEKNFCAGADVKELKEMHPDEALVFSGLGHKVCSHIENLEKPVIAAIKGYAFGGGCELALACDLRIAGEGAKLGLPETNLGIIPGFGGTQRLTRLAGVGKAKEMILTGRSEDAKEALSIGLLNAVVRDEALMEKAEEVAQVLSKKSPITLKMAKALINRNLDIKKGLEIEMVSFSECFASEDHLEGINAFLEKRKPEFKGV